MIDALVSLLLVSGAALVLVAAVGLLRLPDLYTRMHASTKPATLGTSLVVAALALHSADLGIAVRAALIVLFYLLTAPVAAHRLGRAAYRAKVERCARTVRDDLADAERVAERGPGPPLSAASMNSE